VRRSQLEKNELAEARRFLASHTEVLRGLLVTAAERAQNYLLVTNGVAALATLAYMLIRPQAAGEVWCALLLFVAGVICYGIVAAVVFHRTQRDLISWITDVDKFYGDRIELEDVSSNLNSRIKRTRWIGPLLGYVALTAFIAGCGIAIVTLHGTTAQQRALAASPPSAPPVSGTTQAAPAQGAVAAEIAERNEKRELDRRLVGFNGDLAHYTFALAILAALQFAALAGQVVFLRLAFKEAKRGGDIARDAMVAGERAFVFALNLNAYWELDAATQTYSWRFRPVLKNSGDTPTRNMFMHTECVVRTTALPLGFNFDYSTTKIARALIPPNTEVLGGIAPTNPDPAVTAQDVEDAIHGSKFIFIWGWAKYSDVFPETPRHITRFCWLITPVGKPLEFHPDTNPNGVRFPQVHHFEGNCADEECGAFRP
jgi:hypothetical protein